jgi:hypothetical protein
MLADTEIFLKLGLSEKPVEGVHIKYFYLLTIKMSGRPYLPIAIY